MLSLVSFCNSTHRTLIMAEEAPVPELAEQQPGDLQPAAEQAAPDAAAEQAAPAAEDAAAAAAEGGAGKRGREEEEGLDGEEPEAKKHAGLDGQPNVRTLAHSFPLAVMWGHPCRHLAQQFSASPPALSAVLVVVVGGAGGSSRRCCSSS